MSVRAFAGHVGVSWSFVHRVRKGSKAPPLSRITVWADALSLTGAARDHFIDAANWSHVPEEIRPWLRSHMRRSFD